MKVDLALHSNSHAITLSEILLLVVGVPGDFRAEKTASVFEYFIGFYLKIQLCSTFEQSYLDRALASKLLEAVTLGDRWSLRLGGCPPCTSLIGIYLTY